MLKNLFLFLTMLPVSLFAQTLITGKLTSAANKNGVPAASVFLSNTSVGSTSAADGSFTLANVKNGQYDLVVSCLGYEQYHRTLTVNNADIKLDAIELMPKVTALSEVVIKYDPEREKYDLNINRKNNAARDAQIRRFVFEFFGHNPNGLGCKLLNPELLDLYLNRANGDLTVSSPDFLVIENPALGYRIKYLLAEFLYSPQNRTISYSGSFIFEPMKGNAGQEKKWEKNRIAAYRGSDMHFLRACIANDVTEQGFTVRKLVRTMTPDRPTNSYVKAKIDFFSQNTIFTKGFKDSLNYWTEVSSKPPYTQKLEDRPLESKDYIRLTQEKGIYAFGYPDCLQITYRKNEPNTVITFNEPFSYFDSNGVIFNPLSNKMEGAWSIHRIGDLLPVDYELPTTF